MDALLRIRQLATVYGLAYAYEYTEGEHHGLLYDDAHYYAITGDDEGADLLLSQLETRLALVH